MNLKYFLFSVLYIVAFTGEELYAQDPLNNFILDHNIIKSREARRELIYQDIDGSPYYTDNFVKSVLYFPGGDSAEVDLRFDLFVNEMEYRADEKVMWILKNQVRKIAYGDEILIPSGVSGGKDPIYMFILLDGKYSLLRKSSVVFRKAELPRAYQDGVPARFELVSDEFLIQKPDGAPLGAMSKKELEQMFAGNAPALAFIKKEKIKAGKLDHLLKLVNYLNGAEN